MMQADPFFSDLKLFGRSRAFTRMRHRDIVHNFKQRQYGLGFLGFWLIFVTLLGAPFSEGLTLGSAIIFQVGTAECRRMRACGRYWRCNRSIEVLGI